MTRPTVAQNVASIALLLFLRRLHSRGDRGLVGAAEKLADDHRRRVGGDGADITHGAVANGGDARFGGGELLVELGLDALALGFRFLLCAVARALADLA